MCGLDLIVDASGQARQPYKVPEWLKRRGPDDVNTNELHVGPTRVVLSASVLSMRQDLVKQPVALSDNDETCFAWNGEIYQHSSQDGDDIIDCFDHETSDTRMVARFLREDLSHKGIQRSISRLVNAEFAFCVVTASNVYYGLDLLGRRSLLLRHDEDQRIFHLASVGNPDDTSSWREVEPGIVFCYNLRSRLIESLPLEPVTLPTPSLSVPPHQYLYQLLQQAVRRRLNTSHVSILFSGGLDSVVLAALALECVDNVTLINVAFHSDTSDTSIPADTQAALNSSEDLKKLFPARTIHLERRQVTWEEVQAREPHIRQLLWPKQSVMDLNIATALWFAANVSHDRTLLSGLGADEQMGGYGRHRKAASREQLRQELNMDIERLWNRNLGRDDRVFSDNSVEVRFPFLDPWVVSFLKSLPLDAVCNFKLPPGHGDKRILRQVAQDLGLMRAAVAVKRAIQFGSRIAHVSDKKRFGSRRKASGEAKARVVD